jgi:hypothetical protein
MSAFDLVKMFVLSEVIWIAALFLAMIITRVNFSVPRLLIIATVPTVAVLLPIGFFLQLILGTVLMYVLIVKLTDAKLFPDAVLAVMVANVVYVLLGVWVVAQFT